MAAYAGLADRGRFAEVADRGLDHWGRYRDAYGAAGGRWLFRQRRVRVDGWTPGTWAAARRGRTWRPPAPG